MTLLNRPRLKELKKLHKTKNQDKIRAILLEGAIIEWERHLISIRRDKEARKAHIRWVAKRRKEDLIDQERIREQQFVEKMCRIISEGQINVTGNFMKSIKDSELKRKVIEATCLSKV